MGLNDILLAQRWYVFDRWYPVTFPTCDIGFSAGGTDLVFENNHIQNGDDCLTVGSGARNIVFKCFNISANLIVY